MQREKIFGFPMSDELVMQLPEFKEIVDEHSEVTEKEQKSFEHDLCTSLMCVLSLQIQHLWHRASFEMTPSGPVIALANNRTVDTSTTPSPEIIEKMQKAMTLEVKPRWMNAT